VVGGDGALFISDPDERNIKSGHIRGTILDVVMTVQAHGANVDLWVSASYQFINQMIMTISGL